MYEWTVLLGHTGGCIILLDERAERKKPNGKALEDMCARAARRMSIFLGTDLDARKIPKDCHRGQALVLGEHETSI